MLSRLLRWRLSRLRCVQDSYDIQSIPYLSCQAVRSNLQEALRVANGNGSEEDKLEARIEADVYEAIQHALTH